MTLTPEFPPTGLGWPDDVSRETDPDNVSRETPPGHPVGLGWPE